VIQNSCNSGVLSTVVLPWKQSTCLAVAVLCKTEELGHVSWNFLWTCEFNWDASNV